MPRVTSHSKFSRASSSGKPYSARPSSGNTASSTTATGFASGSARSVLNNTNLGQHILTNATIAQTIVDKALLRNTDTVLEVGPGTGNLTVKILDQAKRVVVIEKDPRMAAELLKRVQGVSAQKSKLELILGDFCDATLPFFDVMIANTPYQISSPLVFRILSHRPLFRCAVLMFQLEFCLRLCAKPGSGNFTRLSANVQLYAKVDLLMKVGKGNFRPPPEVESGVVRIVPLDPPPPVRFEEFDGLTRVLFSRGNRTCRSSFAAKGVYDMLAANYAAWCGENGKIPDDTITMKEQVDSILEDTGFSNQRATKMDVVDFLQLLSAFHDQGIHFS